MLHSTREIKRKIEFLQDSDFTDECRYVRIFWGRFSSRGVIMKKLATAAVLCLYFSSANASTLLMIDQPQCNSGARFYSDIGNDLRSIHGMRFKRVMIEHVWPKELRNIAPPTSTPTFILVESGEERGRFSGYSTGRIFWRNVDAMTRSPRLRAGGQHTLSGGHAPH